MVSNPWHSRRAVATRVCTSDVALLDRTAQTGHAVSKLCAATLPLANPTAGDSANAAPPHHLIPAIRDVVRRPNGLPDRVTLAATADPNCNAHLGILCAKTTMLECTALMLCTSLPAIDCSR